MLRGHTDVTSYMFKTKFDQLTLKLFHIGVSKNKLLTKSIKKISTESPLLKAGMATVQKTTFLFIRAIHS